MNNGGDPLFQVQEPINIWFGGLAENFKASQTALAFFWWNKTLQVLTAVEATIINSTMLVQIGVLAWLLLGEELNFIIMLGLALAATGIFIVNWKAALPEP